MINTKVRFGFVLLFLFVSGFHTAHSQTNCSGPRIFDAAACAGDVGSPEEAALFREVNEYRAANKMPTLRLSPSLNMVANRRLLDLRQNLKKLTHSWSNCAYDLKDQKTWTCVSDAPRRLNSGYEGKGYETLFRTTSGTVSTKAALEAWRNSSLHNSIILNQGSFKDVKWDELGVAIDGPFAVLWFGSPNRPSIVVADSDCLGVSLEQATAGLEGLLSIERRSTTISSQTWQGLSADRKIRLDLNGTKEDLTMADLTLAVKLDPNKKLSATNRKVLGTLLKNIFPEWADIDLWLETSANTIARDRTASKTKVVRKILVEMRAEGPDSLKLTVIPRSKVSYVEIF